MKKTRILALLLILLMVMPTLALASESSGEIVKLKFYISSSPISQLDRVQAKANEIIREKIGAEIDIIAVDGSSYADKMNMMINSAEDWDLAFGASWGGMNYFENAATGAYYELTEELIHTYLPQSYARVPDDLWEGVKINGSIYGVINYQVWAVTLAKGISFIEEYAEASGFDYKALKDQGFFAAADALEETYLPYIVENYPDMVPAEYALLDWFAHNSLLFGYDAVGDTTLPGWVKLDAEGKPTVINQYETEEYAKYLEVMNRWYGKGFFRKDAATIQDFMPDRQAGRVGLNLSQPYPFDIPEELESRLAKNYMPHAPQGTSQYAASVRLVKGVLPASKPSEALVTIGANCKNPEKAMELIELLNTDDELYVLLTLGEQDVDWEFVSEDILSDDGEVIIQAGTMRKIDGKYDFFWNEWQLGQSYSPTFTRGINMGSSDSDAVSQEIQLLHYEVDKTATPSPVMGFTFDSDPVKTEIANISAILDEMLLALGSGSISPEEKLPEFIQRLQAAGAGEVIAEKQRQIDAWWEANN